MWIGRYIKDKRKLDVTTNKIKYIGNLIVDRVPSLPAYLINLPSLKNLANLNNLVILKTGVHARLPAIEGIIGSRRIGMLEITITASNLFQLSDMYPFIDNEYIFNIASNMKYEIHTISTNSSHGYEVLTSGFTSSIIKIRPFKKITNNTIGSLIKKPIEDGIFLIIVSICVLIIHLNDKLIK